MKYAKQENPLSGRISLQKRNLNGWEMYDIFSFIDKETNKNKDKTPAGIYAIGKKEIWTITSAGELVERLIISIAANCHEGWRSPSGEPFSEINTECPVL